MSKKISQLTPTTSMQTTDLLTLVRSNINYNITYENFKEGVFSKVRNTVFIDSTYGDNSTAEVENPVKPFLTIAAAHTASAAYWTGGTAPSGSNIITFKIKGEFTETVTIKDWHNYDITDSTINGLIQDNGVACICHIYGNGGSLLNEGGNVITVTGAGELYLDLFRIYGKINCTNDYLNIKALGMYNTDTIFATSGAAVLYVECDSIITLFASTAVYVCGTTDNATFINCSFSSTQEILTTTTASNVSTIKFNNCNLKSTGTNKDTINLLTNTGSNIVLTLKDCTLIASGTGNSIDAAQETYVQIQGSCQTNLTHDTGNVNLLGGTVANGRFLISTDITL